MAKFENNSFATFLHFVYTARNTYYNIIQNLKTSQGYIFRISKHFTTKLCNFTNFRNLFLILRFSNNYSHIGYIPFSCLRRHLKCAIIHVRKHRPTSHCDDNYSQRHSRDTRYCNSNLVCPKYNRETEGGKTFRVTSCKLWNMLKKKNRLRH